MFVNQCFFDLQCDQCQMLNIVVLDENLCHVALNTIEFKNKKNKTFSFFILFFTSSNCNTRTRSSNDTQNGACNKTATLSINIFFKNYVLNLFFFQIKQTLLDVIPAPNHYEPYHLQHYLH